MTKENILNEYYKAEIHYRAMISLLKSEGITPDDPIPTPDPEPAPTPTPTPSPDPEPVVTEPKIIYNGDTNIILNKDETTVISVLFAGVTSTKDIVIMPNMNTLGYKISATKTTKGIREDIQVKGISSGNFKMYIKSAPKDTLIINVTVKY